MIKVSYHHYIQYHITRALPFSTISIVVISDDIFMVLSIVYFSWLTKIVGGYIFQEDLIIGSGLLSKFSNCLQYHIFSSV